MNQTCDVINCLTFIKSCSRLNVHVYVCLFFTVLTCLWLMLATCFAFRIVNQLVACKPKNKLSFPRNVISPTLRNSTLLDTRGVRNLTPNTQPRLLEQGEHNALGKMCCSVGCVMVILVDVRKWNIGCMCSQIWTDFDNMTVIYALNACRTWNVLWRSPLTLEIFSVVRIRLLHRLGLLVTGCLSLRLLFPEWDPADAEIKDPSV